MQIEYRERSNKQSSLGNEIADLIGVVKKEQKKRFAFWYEAVGDKISKAAVPVMKKKGILLIKVQDAVWRFELTRRKDELLEKVNSLLKEDKKIKEIIFK